MIGPGSDKNLSSTTKPRCLNRLYDALTKAPLSDCLKNVYAKQGTEKIKLFRYQDILKPYELVFNAEDVKLVPVLIQVKPKLSRNLKGTHFL